MLETGVRTAVAAGLLVALLLPGAHARAEGVIDVTISNFHYCRAEICTHADTAYLRPAATGPVLEDVVVNPLGVVEVRRGDTVTWTYRDTTMCDRSPPCPAHDVVFEDGSVRSPWLMARTPVPQTFSWTVPETASPGTLVYYYCSVPGNEGYMGHGNQGMTGVLRVVD